MHLSPVETAFNEHLALPSMELSLETYGFPSGYFVIKNVATNRLLDVEAGKVEDGTNIILWTENDSSLVEGERLDITITSALD